jgi:beta-phosphoglucomutase-like phosphatase (HAD superfamily)
MSEPPAVSLVCCDLASLVIDASVVERAFAEAIATQGIVAGTQDYVRSMVRLDRARGRPPADVLTEIFDGDGLRAQAASLAFDRSFRAAAERFGMTAPADVVAALTKVAEVGAKICLLSGLSEGACGDILGGLCRAGLADLALCVENAPRGFPWPDLVLTAMLRLGTRDVREVTVVSATENGVLSGYRAGARIVAGIGGGPRRLKALHEAGATHVLDNVAALPDLIIGAA